jgi:hypothetical protein
VNTAIYAIASRDIKESSISSDKTWLIGQLQKEIRITQSLKLKLVTFKTNSILFDPMKEKN